MEKCDLAAAERAVWSRKSTRGRLRKVAAVWSKGEYAQLLRLYGDRGEATINIVHLLGDALPGVVFLDLLAADGADSCTSEQDRRRV